MGRDDEGDWSELEALTVRGFSFNAIHAGRFSGEPKSRSVSRGCFDSLRL